ncbi:MAG TPA: M23 family metallopeptidase, partial [Polyangiaceae bacterium]
MILSPPFLPVRHAAASTPADPEAFDNDDDEHDAAYVTTAMDGGVPGAGAYPVSFEMNWHGGMHLTAPKDDQGARLRVRAIADGTVVFRRNPRAKTTTPTDPLNYGGWTDNGCVVIRHDSEIGAAATGAATAVTFYSIYMHLNAIPAEIVVNQPVYRKAEVGTAGSVYGLADSIHFEIVCDSANVKRLTGRSDTYLSVDDDGRADAVFGTMWFFLRTGTPFYAADPTPPTPRRGHPPPHVVPPAQSYTNTEALWVGMTFRRGACIMQTRHLDGRPLGTPIREADYEYKLEARSHERFPGHPSAGFQLLRFGRVLDNADTLTPANAPHWRQVAYDGGSGWVDLNAA